ncbi:MAG: sulfite exporter TauE/SafE family protein [Rhodospirillales bacterium]
MFLAGLLGSVTHCAGMCGPFVLAQTVARLEAMPTQRMSEMRRLTGAALLPYHLGRATTYAALGTVGGALAAGTIAVTGLRWLAAVLLGLAALFFLGYAVRSLGWLPPRALGQPVSAGDDAFARRIGRLTRPLFARPVGWRGYVLGIALGFLPCGLLYGALAAAAATGQPLAAAFAMLAFAAGTVPMLLAVATVGHVVGQHFRAAALQLAPALMLVNAAALSYLAWRTVV